MDIWERSDTIKLTIDYGSASKLYILPDCSEYVSFLLHVSSIIVAAVE
jgi:hypothetical protein